MITNYVVYWYRLPEHKDPNLDGYIGITNNMNRRNLEHLRNKKTNHFTNALKKYSDISYVILHSVPSPEEALALEYEYRPQPNMGWNSAIGGEDTLKSVRSTPITVYHKDNYVITFTYASITEAAIALNTTVGRLTQAKYRNRINYGIDGWAVLLDPMHDRTTTLTTSEVLHQMTLGTKRTKPSHYKGITNRWSDEDKLRISKQHKGKVISEKQKETMRTKNRHSPQCKQVTLVHSSALDIVYTYHSISEAARQLDLPLSRLKSKALAPLNRFGNDGWAITNLGSG